ncbi:hypothetical protein PHMEG_00011824 [Phytophthora megakarya]|uniref:Helitron helicase n=1 Tax=Phytophthora megakarya TaxID=4795 RepID=A0A225WBB2_9STRA|nr:hypothetical protein PHMEG_00011824 [Phytophthora megakarya]
MAVVRQFKPNAPLDDITKICIFGKVAASVDVVEFENRGPHAHIFIALKDDWKPQNSSDYDTFVSAEILDTGLYPERHATMTTCMIHRPGGRGIISPGTGEDGVCSKRFRNDFSDETRVDGTSCDYDNMYDSSSWRTEYAPEDFVTISRMKRE